MTCYKAFTKEVLDETVKHMISQRFGFEVEFTAKVADKEYKIVEVPISYYPRSVKAGKHMKLKDALECVWSVIKFKFEK
jgi:hypothetical protein